MQSQIRTVHPLVHHAGGQHGIGGPTVKLWRMQRYFPDTPTDYNIIYSVSARISADVCRKAQRRGVRTVCHVNSVFHPAYRPNHEKLNAPIDAVHALADHVIYGSPFAAEGANRYLGSTSNKHTIIYNAVDVAHFRPSSTPPSPDRFHILAIGVHYLRHRLEPLIWAMPHITKRYPHARLIIAGPLKSGSGAFDCGPETIRQTLNDAGVSEVEFIPQYTQFQAPQTYAQGDVLVHLKHMDWTPNTVIEGMACGLPIIHVGNGGMTDLVGEAGISLGLPFDWDHIHTPDPALLAKYIVAAYEKRDVLGKYAREIAVKRYNMDLWVNKHQYVFEKLLN